MHALELLKLTFVEIIIKIIYNLLPIHNIWGLSSLKAATGRPCVLASAHSGIVPATTCDCFSVAESLMRRRHVDLCVTASSRTMLTFENNVSCSSRDCSTIAFCRR